MAWHAFTDKDISSAGVKRGVTILKALVDMWGGDPVNYSGAVGCFYCESQCNPTAYNKAEKNGTFKGSTANGSGYGAGIAQWSKTWKADILKKFSKYTPIENWSMQEQIAIVKRTCTKTFVDKLKACKTCSASTDIWLRGYENGGGGSGGLCSTAAIDNYKWCNGYKGAMLNRTYAAQKILEALKGGKVTPDEIGDLENFAPGAEGSEMDANAVGANYGVLTSSGDNVYGNFKVADTSTAPVKHTRIYSAFSSGTKLDTMSLPANFLDIPKEAVVDSSANTEASATTTTSNSSTGNSSTGQAKFKASTPSSDSSTSTTTSNTIIDSSTGATTLQGTGQVVDTSTGGSDVSPLVPDAKYGLLEQGLLGIGVEYPLIRINDYYINHKQIEYFALRTVDFVPTAELRFTTIDSNPLKEDIIKDGDIMSIFILPTTAALKSLRCDLLITSFISPTITNQKSNQSYSYVIFAELYVNNLYNNNITFAFSGTSRDALIYAALQLKLGFFFNDPDNTQDEQMWYCTTESESEETSDEPRPSNIKEFLISTTLHAWKNFESFFNSWIDPRYGLTFLNVNKQLGETGPDEKIDMIPIQASMTKSRAANTNKGTITIDEEKKNIADGKGPIPQVKMFTNIPLDNDTNTPLYVKQYHIINQAGEISRQMGINIQYNFVVDNQGVDSSNAPITMNFSIPYNEWKLKHGFYLQIGPGRNNTYEPGDAFSQFVKSQTKKVGGISTDIQADTDGETITETGDNMDATGSTNKFYDTGLEHNKMNNLLLLKKYVKFELSGINFGIMRGEKIPALMIELNDYQQALNNPDDAENVKLEKFVNIDMSGWFIIDGIEWIFDPINTTGESNWTTHVKLIRREWPISADSLIPKESEASTTDVITIVPTGGTSIESKQGNSDVADTSTNTEATNNEPVNMTDGLEPYMQVLWDSYLSKYQGVELVQGRWYAVNESGEKCAGYPYILNGGQYKCMNEKSEILYLSTKNWYHFFGRGINVMPKTSIAEFWKVLAADKAVLKHMFDNGISAYKETWKVGSVTSDSVHFGTATEQQKTFWTIIFNINPELKDEFSAYLGNNTNNKLPNKEKADIKESEIKNQS